MPKCEICRGLQIIRLPVHRNLHVFSDFTGNELSASTPTSRTFPCPECSETVAHDRIAIVQHHSIVDTRYGSDPRFIEYVREEAATTLAHSILASNFIQFERGPDDILQMTFPTRATVGVVSPRHVATIEGRIIERQMEIAQEVVRATIAGITNWNSQYSGPEGSISKDQATRQVREALEIVTRRWEKAH